MTNHVMLQNFQNRFAQHFGDLAVTWRFTSEPTASHAVVGEVVYRGHIFHIIGCWKDQVDIQLVPPQGKSISPYSTSDGFATLRVTSHQRANLEHLYWNFERLVEETSLILRGYRGSSKSNRRVPRILS